MSRHASGPILQWPISRYLRPMLSASTSPRGPEVVGGGGRVRECARDTHIAAGVDAPGIEPSLPASPQMTARTPPRAVATSYG
jgi:hypothetical protein